VVFRFSPGSYCRGGEAHFNFSQAKYSGGIYAEAVELLIIWSKHGNI